MTDENTLIGFDGSADGDVSLVVLHREPGGGWRIESTEGPDAQAWSRLVTAAIAAHPPTHRPPADTEQPTLTEQVNRWITEWSGEGQFVLTEWQTTMIEEIYGDHIRDGKVTHSPLVRSRLS